MIARDVGLAFPVGQTIKKSKETKRLPPAGKLREILGAINYLAIAYIIITEKKNNALRLPAAADQKQAVRYAEGVGHD